MASPIHQVLYACLLLAVVAHTGAVRRRRPSIPGKTQPQPTTQPRAPSDLQVQQNQGNNNAMADMERRMANIEQGASVIKTEMQETKSENTRLKEDIQRMEVVMGQRDEANQRVNELERLLTKFENFFGLLYTDLPDVFAREIPVTERLSALNEYIGNREAELMSLRPNPPVVKADPEENPVDEELLGVAMDELNTENVKLRRRLDDMETRMVAVPLPGDGDTNNPGGAIPAPPDDETQERLTRLERILALQLADQLDENPDDMNPDGLNLGVGKKISTGGTPVALSKSDTEILREELNSVRSIASTRKSVFSAASTRHLNGEAGVHKPVVFDHIFANKGNHFQEQNSTFICGITGFYFFTFTSRSYDNRYLGVSLLKNGERVASVSGERDPERNQMMTQSVVLHLTLGDQMWLTLAPSNNFAIYSDQSKYCTFSGFLLFKGS